MRAKIQSELIHKYKCNWQLGTPKYYLDFPPTIPFIGDEYFERKHRIFVYASAENLTYALKNANAEINRLNHDRNIDDAIMMRHRYFFEKSNPRDNWYPNIHLGPIEDGGMLLVAKYIAEMRYPSSFSDEPYTFINQICCGNFGKFSLAGKTNTDYASSIKFLNDSIPYVIEDIDTLNPNCIVLPITILRELKRSKEENAIRLMEILATKHVIGIYQVNQQVINRAIKLKSQNREINEYPWLYPWINSLKTRIQIRKYLEWLHPEIDKMGTH